MRQNLLVHINAAQHSVNPIPGNVRWGWRGGSRRVFRQFAWRRVGSDKIALPRPAQPPVTRAVGQFFYKL
jgi:hypothetical protein